MLDAQIEALDLGSFYEVQNSLIRGANGSEFVFAGLRNNVAKIKSFEGVDRVWVEEAQSVSKPSWETLVPTIRKEHSEIWVTYNPELATDETHQRFVIHPPAAPLWSRSIGMTTHGSPKPCGGKKTNSRRAIMMPT